MRATKKLIPVNVEKITEDQDIETLEGTLHATKGNWLITGVNGEKYPIRDDIFRKTYDIVEPLKSPYIKIEWQKGTRSEFGQNGADVRDVLSEAYKRTKELNDIHPCEENLSTMNHIREAITQQYLRTVDRKKRGVKGKYKD